MREGTTYIGLDAHKKTIQVCLLRSNREEPLEWQVVNEPGAVRRMAKKILKESQGEVLSCYEAGPCGYALQRQLRAAGVACQVIAPSLIPVKPGDRIKTDKRDARKLAELLRANLLTEVQPPNAEEEAIRDLLRCREDAQEDLARCRHRLTKMLLRRGFAWHQTAWTQKHWYWIRTLPFEQPADQTILADYQLAIEQTEERIRTLETKIEAIAQREPYREPVAWLRCFRGINTTTAMTVVAELHNFSRFHAPRELMGFLGLVPSEYSSADTRKQGAITKAGNSHVRRVLVEAAWHYRHPFTIGKSLRQRREGQPETIIALADKCGQRLHRRFSRLTTRGKPTCKIIVAVARELVGFIWAALYPRAVKAA